MDASPTSPTAATVQLQPPASGGPVDSYQVSLCPAAGGACVNATCPTTTCPVTGLKPDTTYTATAVAVVGGKPRPVSNAVDVSTPPAGAPTLTDATATSGTTATATATPPMGTNFTLVSGQAPCQHDNTCCGAPFWAACLLPACPAMCCCQQTGGPAMC